MVNADYEVMESHSIPSKDMIQVVRVRRGELLTRISEICILGLVGLSIHTSLVFGPTAEATSPRSLVFTRLQYH